ncbi:Ig-like domain-containing protein [Myxococcaceae bacterium GXIMD 01537]
MSPLLRSSFRALCPLALLALSACGDSQVAPPPSSGSVETAFNLRAPVVTAAALGSRVEVAGVLTSGARVRTLQVSLDGEPARDVPFSAEGATYRFFLMVATQPGAHTLVLTAVDEAGQRTETALDITVPKPPDVKAPAVALTSPEAGGVSGQPSVEVRGTARDEAGVKTLRFRVGDGAFAEPEGILWEADTFRFTVPLSVGAHTVEVEALDAAGNRAVASAAIEVRDEQPPALTLKTPLEGRVLSLYGVQVEFSAEDAFGISKLGYALNGGTEQTVAAPATAVSLTPRPGENVLTLTARDTNGLRTERQVRFFYGARTMAGAAHSGAVVNEVLYSWGRNNRGQLGQGTSAPDGQKTPAAVSGLSGVATATFGQNSALAIRRDGTVWTWGENGSGQLGLGTPPVEGETHTPDVAMRAVPYAVPGLTDVVAGAVGYDHMLVLRADGTVWAFGLNNVGQLGDGTTVSRDYPVRVQGLTDVVRVIAGSQHSAAIRADGSVWAWGRNQYGNLGQGTSDTLPHAQPLQVPGLSDVVDLASGRDHLLALHSDGAVSAWGLNASGQVGNGVSGENVTRPQRLSAVSGAVSVSANGNYSLTVNARGEVRGWGQNGTGQLGVGHKNNLTQAGDAVGGLQGARSVAAGATHVIALREDGHHFAWGWSFKGSMGRADALESWTYTAPLEVELP